jgi:hypothetical protein
MYEAEKKIQDTKVTNPIIKGLIAYYQSTQVLYQGVRYKYNANYVPDRLRDKEFDDPELTDDDRAEMVSYSQKAVEFLELHKDDVDLDDSLRNARTYYGDFAIGYHELITYYVYETPRAEHVRLCRCCGRPFNYEHLIKPVNLRTGLLSIPVKCEDCSNSKNY